LAVFGPSHLHRLPLPGRVGGARVSLDHVSFVLFFFLTIRHPPTSTPFPYTTLFRSRDQADPEAAPAGGAAREHSETGQEQPERRSEEHTSELQSRGHLVCRLMLEKKNRRCSRAPRSWRSSLSPWPCGSSSGCSRCCA